MIREILGTILAAITAYFAGLLVGRVVSAIFLVVSLTAGLTAFFVTLFGVVGLYALAGSPPDFAPAAGVLAFGGGLVVASIVVIKLVRWGGRHLTPDDTPSDPKPAGRSRADVMTTVAALDRHLARPADDDATDRNDRVRV